MSTSHVSNLKTFNQWNAFNFQQPKMLLAKIKDLERIPIKLI